MTLGQVEGIGPRIFRRLVREFGSARKVLSASPKDIRDIRGIGNERAQLIRKASGNVGQTGNNIAAIKNRGIDVITFSDASYPRKLLKLEDDAPIFLYVKGTLKVEDEKCVAIVGTHKATQRGMKDALKLARSLAEEGVTIASGLALGIDTEAHRGALEKGRTIGVLGSGLERVYPRDNKELADRIIKRGALISEYEPNTGVSVGRLMSRNRVVVGISKVLIVVEALINSAGTMEALERAKQQRKTVYALKPKGLSEAAGGFEELIKVGAVALERADLLEMVLQSVKGK